MDYKFASYCSDVNTGRNHKVMSSTHYTRGCSLRVRISSAWTPVPEQENLLTDKCVYFKNRPYADSSSLVSTLKTGTTGACGDLQSQLTLMHDD